MGKRPPWVPKKNDGWQWMPKEDNWQSMPDATPAHGDESWQRMPHGDDSWQSMPAKDATLAHGDESW